MKKLLIAFCMLLGFATASIAQSTAPMQPKPKAAKKATTTTKTTTTAGPTKKDGTPDMRYKANKTAAKPAGPMKKDGTPDKRYKANKTTTTAPASTK